MRLPERHVVNRLGWLRAAVLGANDGVLSTSSLIIGVASAQDTHASTLVAGEYVSVSSQADSEAADLARERRELADDHNGRRPSWLQSMSAAAYSPALRPGSLHS